MEVQVTVVLADGGLFSLRSKMSEDRQPRTSRLVMSWSPSWQFFRPSSHRHTMAASVLNVKFAFKAGRRGLRTASALSIHLNGRARHFPEVPGNSHWHVIGRNYQRTILQTSIKEGKGEVWN